MLNVFIQIIQKTSDIISPAAASSWSGVVDGPYVGVGLIFTELLSSQNKADCHKLSWTITTDDVLLFKVSESLTFSDHIA